MTARKAFTVSALSLMPMLGTNIARADTPGGFAYRSIGPAIAGGRATAVAGSDADPRVYYAGGAAGGVFKSLDGGASWKPVFDGEPVAAIGAIAVAANDPNNVWVGTGEANPRNDVEEGDGLWHSSDGGDHWTHVGLDDGGSIASISLNPKDASDVAVGVLGHLFRDNDMRGVFVTHDAGAHWTHSLALGPQVGVSDMTRSPDRPNVLFAGLWRFQRRPYTFTSGGGSGGLYRSEDDGATWTRLQGSGLPDAPTARIGVSAGRNGRVYAIIESKRGDLWRSDDGGATWRLMPHSPYVGARPFYFSHIFVDPVDPDRLINVALVLSMSVDGGRSFKAISTDVGWDYHSIWWSADGRRAINASDEGVLVSADGGEHYWQSYALPFAQPYHLGLGGPSPYYVVCVGLQDDNSWCGPSSADNGTAVLNRDWVQIAQGDGMWSLFDPRDPTTVWSTSRNNDNGQVYRSNTSTRQAVEVSPDAETNGGLAPSSLSYRFNWDNPLAFQNDGTVLAGGNVVFASSDRGRTWRAISPDLTRNDPQLQQRPGGPVALDGSGAETYDTLLDVVTTPLRDGLIWASSDDGLVHVTRDGGATWRDVTPPGVPRLARIMTVEAGHRDPNVAYAAAENHMNGDVAPYIYRTADGGATWQSLGSGLPRDVFVRVIREDPADPRTLYVGTQRGVYASFDRGVQWQPLRYNMPATPIYDLAIEPKMDDLVVAAHGRGVWILDDLHAVRTLAGKTPHDVTLIRPRDSYRAYNAPETNIFKDGTLPANVFTGRNAAYGALITYSLPAAMKHVRIEILDEQRHVVRHLADKNVPRTSGVHRVSWNMTEDGPTKWSGTYEDNRGPDDGAEVVPGRYIVALKSDGASLEAPIVVKPDPRDTGSIGSWQRRERAISELTAEVDGVDRVLNALDARLSKSGSQDESALRALRANLTADPQNVEDLSGTTQFRERVIDVLTRLSASKFEPPNEAQVREISRLESEYEALRTRAGALHVQK